MGFPPRWLFLYLADLRSVIQVLRLLLGIVHIIPYDSSPFSLLPPPPPTSLEFLNLSLLYFIFSFFEIVTSRKKKQKKYLLTVFFRCNGHRWIPPSRSLADSKVLSIKLIKLYLSGYVIRDPVTESVFAMTFNVRNKFFKMKNHPWNFSILSKRNFYSQSPTALTRADDKLNGEGERRRGREIERGGETRETRFERKAKKYSRKKTRFATHSGTIFTIFAAGFRESARLRTRLFVPIKRTWPAIPSN